VAPTYPSANGGLRSLVTEEWHLVLSESGHTELFAWREDPKESSNLAQSQVGRQVVLDCQRQLRELVR
jgi:hypothetical protein